MAAETVRYGLSGILGPPTPVPGESPELLAEANRHHEENRAKLAVAGRAHWLLAHQTPHWTAETFQQWVDGIPRFGCSCHKDAEQYIAANPPPIGDDAGMRLWFYAFHEKKNADLAKPPFPYADAAAKYGWPTPEA